MQNILLSSYRWLAAMLLGSATLCHAVSSLAPGDVAVVGFNADGTEDFSFVTLVDIDGNVSFNIHEDSTLRDEGIYTTPPEGLTNGTVVVIINPKTATGVSSASIGTILFPSYPDSWSFGNGDLIAIEQGATAIYLAETTSTAIPPPPGLSSGAYTIVSHPDNTDVGYYGGIRTGTRSNLLAAIADTANWTYADSAADDFVDLNVFPHNEPFTIEADPPPPPPPPGSPNESVSEVFEGWRFTTQAPFDGGTAIGATRLASLRQDNDDALSSDCKAWPKGSIALRAWFSVYFTNAISESASVSSVKLHIQHQGPATKSGTFKVYTSDNRTVTKWYKGTTTTSSSMVTGDIAWNDAEQETILDLASELDTVSRITNSEFVVVNSLSSLDSVYFDYFKLVVEFSSAPTLNNASATEITTDSARLNGALTTASPIPDVYFYWGDEDGVTNTANWDHVVALGTNGLGPFSAPISGLLPNKEYFYRAFGSNSQGSAWAPSTASFTTALPKVRFATNSSTVAENAGQVSVQVELSEPSTQAATVGVSATGGTAINGQDYVYVNGNVTIAAGAISTTATFVVSQDVFDEFDETILFTLSVPTGAAIDEPSSHTVTVIDDDSPPSVEFLLSPSNTVESFGPATIALVLSVPSGKPVSVNYATEDVDAEAGLDYTAKTGLITWTPYSPATQLVSVALLPDEISEPSETLRIQLSTPTNATVGASAPGHIVIVDDDTGPPFLGSFLNATLISSNAVTLQGYLDSYGGAPTKAWFYFGTTDGGTSTNTWENNVLIGLIDNGSFELPVGSLQQTTPYFFRVLATNVYGMAWSTNASTFVTGPPLVQFSAAADSRSEATSPIPIGLNISFPSAYAHPVTMTISATGGTATAGIDYTLSNTVVVLDAGQTSTNFHLFVTPDSIPEADETVELFLSQIVNGRAGPQVTFTYTINNDDTQPDMAFSQSPYTVSESDGSVLISLTLNTTSALDIAVNYTTLDGTAKKNVDYLTRSGSFLWPAGSAETKSFSVPLLNNSESTGDRFFQVSLTGIQNATALSGTLVDVNIEEDDISLPEVSNADGATGIRSRIAILNGEVIRGVPPPDVTLYWGTSDGDTTPGAWDHAVALGRHDGAFNHEISGLTSNTLYYYRAYVQNTSGASWAASTTNFTSTGAVDYYVNDGSLANDVYCSAVGNDANSGALPSKPKANLKTLLDTIDIEPGDTIWVDTGNYSIPSTIKFTSADVGAPGATVLIRGSHHAAGSDFTAASVDGIEVNVAGDAYVRFENIHISGAVHGFYIHGTGASKCRSTEIVGCDVSNNASSEGGIYMVQCDGVVIERCIANNDGLAGIFLNVCTDVVVVSNTCSLNWAWGIIGQSTFNPVVKYNTCHSQNVLGEGYGISFSAGNNEVLIGNRCYNNKTDGIYISGQYSRLEDNVCYDNDRDGINLTGSGLALSGNTLYDNGRYGMTTPGNNGLKAYHNLAFDNGSYNLHLSSIDVRAQLEFNTLYGGKGLYINRPRAVTNRNNIIWATGAGNFAIEIPTIPTGGNDLLSDYNNLYATASANAGKWGAQACGNIGDWQFYSWKDPNSMGVDPRFVSTGTHDFHLQSRNASWHGGLWQADLQTSPCIDAGVPTASFSRETPYNGLRVNLGAYGNTEQASRTDYDGPLYTLTVSLAPSQAGRFWVTPEASVFPTNYVVTLSTVLTNASYRWDRWSGDLTSTNMIISFTMTNDVFALAQFAALYSNTNGVPDMWLIGHGQPVNQDGADADPDRDGHSNWQEYHAGTDPTNTQSVLMFTLLEPTVSERIELSVFSISGKAYKVRSRPNASPFVWALEPVSTTDTGPLSTTPVPGTGDTLLLYVAAPGNARAYRVETAP